jgi:hypothetical protein
MAIDLTLCVVPSQIAAIISKAAADAAYAEWVAFVPSMLQNPAFNDHGLREVQELKADLNHLKSFFQYTTDCHFYDSYRCTSTLDYLLGCHERQQQFTLAPRPLWEGGNVLSAGIVGSQGIPVRLYDRAAITTIYELLMSLDPTDLLAHYDYQKLLDTGVYKATRPENTDIIPYTFYAIEELFRIACENDNLLILKVLD